MSETPTPALPHATGLAGLVEALRRFAETSAEGMLPDGTHPTPEAVAADRRTLDARVADAYAHAAAMLETHLVRLRDVDQIRLRDIDLRARLTVVEAELGRKNYEADHYAHALGAITMAALGLTPEDIRGRDAPDDPVAAVTAERETWRRDYDRACKTMAEMHAAAHGGVTRGTVQGVVEDVWRLRVVCEAVTQAAEKYLNRSDADGVTAAKMRLDLVGAVTEAYMVLHPADAEEHHEPIDVVTAIGDVLAMRVIFAQLADGLEKLPRLPSGERKKLRVSLTDMAREYAGQPPYPQTEFHGEIAAGLLADAHKLLVDEDGEWGQEWSAKATALADRIARHLGTGEWSTLAARGADHEMTAVELRDAVRHIRGLIVAARGTDRASTLAAIQEIVWPDPMQRAASTNQCEADADAARRFAAELERLREGLHERGITAGPHAQVTSAFEWPVTTALMLIGNPAVKAAPGTEAPDPLAPMPALVEQAATLLDEIEDRWNSGLSERAGAMALALRMKLADPGPAPLRPSQTLEQAPGNVDDLAMLPELEHLAGALDAVPNLALKRDMQHIAAAYRGLAYDPHDRPAEVLAVRRAAVEAGLTPFPSDLAPPRGYRGATPPVKKVIVNDGDRPMTVTGPTSGGSHQAANLAPGDSLTVTIDPAGTVS